MGVVYVARDERLERTVALKTMSSLANDETARMRFWPEARAASRKHSFKRGRFLILRIRATNGCKRS
jgi:hypothetical protein